MQRIINFLNKAEIWFFYGFLVTFTLSIRKVLFFYPIKGQFNEYTGIYLYLSDIFLFLVLSSWLISIIYNNIIYLSRYKQALLPYLKQKVVVIPLLLVVFSFISAIWADNWQVSIFRSIKLAEFYFLYLWVIFRIVPPQYKCSTWNILRGKRGTSSLQMRWNKTLKNILLIIIATGLIQSIIGIWQFIIQKSAGLFWLKESLISPEIAGVAKIILDGEKYIRVYGLFPHSNILGGFLVLSAILTLLYKRLFKIKEYLYYSILIVQLIALFLTFSKSAIIGLILVLSYLGLKKHIKLFHMEQFKYFALIAGILFLLIVIIKPDWYSVMGKGIEDRIFYLNVSRGTFLENPILGVGSGQFVLNLENIKNIQNWQFQPVHNVFLLILNELGLIGLVLFLWFIYKLINVPRGTLGFYAKAVFIGFLFIMLFDHYFWDIQQGQIMLWLVLGLLVGGKVWTINKFNTYPQDKVEYIDK